MFDPRAIVPLAQARSVGATRLGIAPPDAVVGRALEQLRSVPARPRAEHDQAPVGRDGGVHSPVEDFSGGLRRLSRAGKPGERKRRDDTEESA